MSKRNTIFYCCLVLCNIAFFFFLEWGASTAVQKFGIKSSETRIFGAKNGRDGDFIVQVDERLGYRITPKNNDASMVEDSTGRVFPRQKPQGTYRIICLGGSTTYGVGADRTNAYPIILEDLLRLIYSHCNIQFEVLNFGVMGYHSWHSRIRLKEELLPLNPDLVLTMDAVNDLVCSLTADNSLAFAQEKNLLLGLTNTETNAGFLTRVDTFCSKHLNLYVLLKNLGNMLSQGQISPTDLERKIKAFGYYDNIVTMAQESQRHQIDFGIINYPWLAQPSISPDAPELLRNASSSLYLFGRDWFPNTNADIAKKTNTAFINPQPQFDAMIAQTSKHGNELYFDEIHFTKFGNLILASEVFQGLTKVPSFQKNTASCPVSNQVDALVNAVKLQDPRIHFSNGWPREGETPLPLKLIHSENLTIAPPDNSGRQSLYPTDAGQQAVISFKATLVVNSLPMRYNPYTAFFFPRLSGPSDSVEIQADDKDVLHMRGMRSAHWTGISERFGLCLPPLTPDSVVTVRLSGHAQIWQIDGNMLFSNDETPPGY